MSGTFKKNELFVEERKKKIEKKKAIRNKQQKNAGITRKGSGTESKKNKKGYQQVLTSR